jgi:hypothetical protein
MSPLTINIVLTFIFGLLILDDQQTRWSFWIRCLIFHVGLWLIEGVILL